MNSSCCAASGKACAWPAVVPDPAVAFARLARRRGAFWLDSSLQRPGDGRYSAMGCEPRWVFTACADAWRIESCDGVVKQGPNGALEKLDELLAAHRVAPANTIALPFWGGAVGWFAYDLGRQFEAIGVVAAEDRARADVRLAWHDAALVWDHATGDAWWVAHDRFRPAESAVAELAAAVENATEDDGGNVRPSESSSPVAVASNLTREEYMARVETIRAAIARGEVYQANLVQRFTCAQREPAAAIYLRLRAANPAPFALYQDAGDIAVLSSSPERFLEVEPDGRVRTCPIKGTRPRGATPAEDAARAAKLLGSVKERAELLMIVDLLRNDLGRVCEWGSVRVPRLHALESFATVHHLVGEVTGRLRAEMTLGGLLRATFPGGSITGAPKIAAMQLIERLEPHRRGVAMGALGYVSAHGRVDLNIAIRTIVCDGARAEFHVGAGIVWDSHPADEYEETLAKARALFRAVGAEPDSSGTGAPVGA